MTHKRVYLDNSATTSINKEVLETMKPFLENLYCNPSAVYQDTIAVRRIMDQARASVAVALNCKPEEIFFTSGGTESDNWALQGMMKNKEYNRLLTSEIEHPAIYNTAEALNRMGHDVYHIKTQPNGMIDIENFKQKMFYREPSLISVMLANNETGVIQPINEIVKHSKNCMCCVHTDAVQAIGHMKVDVQELGVDLLSLSGHKFHAPKGVGVLYVKKGTPLQNLMYGGKQENRLRPGTENVASIVGLAKAITIATDNLDANINKMKQLRNLLQNTLKENIPTMTINGDIDNRLPNILNASFKGITGTTMVTLLDLEGISISSGSACNASDFVMPSRVLKAMGKTDEEAQEGVRFSLSCETTKEEILYTIEKVMQVVNNTIL